MRQQENHIYSALTQGGLLHICAASDCKHTCNIRSCWCLFILWKFFKYPDKHQYEEEPEGKKKSNNMSSLSQILLPLTYFIDECKGIYITWITFKKVYNIKYKKTLGAWTYTAALQCVLNIYFRVTREYHSIAIFAFLITFPFAKVLYVQDSQLYS